MSKKWPYLPAIRDVREGTILEADDGFTCLKDGARRKVMRDTGPMQHVVPHRTTLTDVPMNSRERLYIKCAYGRHSLSGQECHQGEHGVKTPHYVGLKIVRQP